VPLASVTFATLAPRLRNEGTAFFSLMRNLGSSVGISVVETLLTRKTQIMHARLAEHVSPFNPALTAQAPNAISTTSGLATLNHSVTNQASIIAYLNDFKLMLVLTLVTIPLVALLRGARRQGGGDEPVIVE
jgi:DHA2 family multidrug resistance protein